MISIAMNRTVMNRLASIGKTSLFIMTLALAISVPALAQTPVEKKRTMQMRLDAERSAAVSRSQHRLSETAPPQPVSQDRALNDPALRRHVRGANSAVHP